MLLVAIALPAGAQVAHSLPKGTPARAFDSPICSGILPGAPAHPSAAEVLQRQELAGADPTFLLSPEPVENIGIVRFRLRDYLDCTGAEGCYWGRS